MKAFECLLFTNRPIVQALFSGLKGLEHQHFRINCMSIALEALTDHAEEIALATVAAIDVAPDPIAAIELCCKLHEQRPSIALLGIICCKKQICLSHVQALMAAGVTGLLGSFVTPEEILRALELVACGHTVVQLELGDDNNLPLADIMTSRTRGDDTASLKLFVGDEARLLELVAQGLTDREIGQQLYISPSTTHHHIERLCKATGARNRTELAAWAGARGFYGLSQDHGEAEESRGGRLSLRFNHEEISGSRGRES